MEHFVKLIVLVVITAVGTSFLAPPSLLLHAQPRERPAGCHEHGTKAPAPHSTSYQCCLTGHNTAIPQTSHTPEPILYDMQTDPLIDFPIGSLLARASGLLTVSSGDPPGAMPLRI